jgi:GxxExxY protein
MRESQLMPYESTAKALVASDALTQKVIGEAMYVHRVLGFGFNESVYHNSLLKRLGKLGVRFESQKPLPVFFEDELVGDFVADVIVENRVILELKSVASLLAAHEAQLVNYLTATKIPVGLLLNFGPKSLEVKRRVLGYIPSALREDDSSYTSSLASSL